MYSVIGNDQKPKIKNYYASRVFRMSLVSLFVLLYLSACASLESLGYGIGVYYPKTEKIDLLVHVEDGNGQSLNNLTLNDFYVMHNGKPLTVREGLRLDLRRSTVALYVVVLIDLQENGHSSSFQLMKDGLQAYINIQPEWTYTKLIGYDQNAYELHSTFTNDKFFLLGILSELKPRNTESNDGIFEALELAQDSIKRLPGGRRLMDLKRLSREQLDSDQFPLLYDSAILWANQNPVDGSIIPEDQNILIVDSSNGVEDWNTGESSSPEESSGEEDYENLERDFYRELIILSEDDLTNNYPLDQKFVVNLYGEAWKNLNNLVNGYYWLTYKKFFNRREKEEQEIFVFLNQYSRDQRRVDLYEISSEQLDKDFRPEGPFNEKPRIEENQPQFGRGIKSNQSLHDENRIRQQNLLKTRATSTNQLENSESSLSLNRKTAEQKKPPANESISGSPASLLPRKPSNKSFDQKPINRQHSLRGPSAENKSSARHNFPLVGRADPDSPPIKPTRPLSQKSNMEILKEKSLPTLEKNIEILDFPFEAYTDWENPDLQVQYAPSATATIIELPSAVTKKFTEEGEVKANPLPIADTEKKFYIQIGSFKIVENLYRSIQELSSFEDKINILSAEVNGKSYTRCILGSYGKEEALAVLENMKSRGFSDSFLIQDLERWFH